MLNVVLRRYVYRSYFQLLKDKEFLKLLYQHSWIQPAVIPGANYLRGNHLIRKYLTKSLTALLADSDFVKLLLAAGFTRYSVITTTTTSTTTTTTTTIPPIDPDAQAFITAAGITDNTQKSAIIQLVGDLKSNNLWTKMLAIYPIVGGTATTHKFNLANPVDSDGAFRLTFPSGATHSAAGITWSSQYADTKLVPSTQLSVGSLSMGYYSSTNQPGGASVEMGAFDGTTLDLLTGFSGVAYFRSGADTSSVGIANTLGLINGSSFSSVHTLYHNGVSINSGASSGGSLPVVSIFLGARDSSGVASDFSSKVCSFAYISTGLSDANVLALYNLVQTYQTTLGRQV